MLVATSSRGAAVIMAVPAARLRSRLFMLSLRTVRANQDTSVQNCDGPHPRDRPDQAVPDEDVKGRVHAAVVEVERVGGRAVVVPVAERLPLQWVVAGDAAGDQVGDHGAGAVT